MEKIILSVIMIIIVFFIIYFLSKKYKLQKEQMIIFWLLVLFWTSISIIRSYRKLYATTPISNGGLGLSLILGAEIASAYGLISVILRLPLFFSSDIIKRRKIFIQFAMVSIIITSFLVFKNASFNTLYYSSLAMGICASMLAIFNVMFSETFSKQHASISASILSVAPLLAEFIAAPIQYIFTFSDFKNYNYLWLISCLIAIVALILSFFIKENIKEGKNFSISKVKIVISNKSFLFICFVGILISFMKFSTTGANMINYAKITLNMPALQLAYLDTVFSGFQLISSVLIGTYFAKKYGIEKALLISLTCFTMFFVISIFNKNPLILFISYSLIGFGYGGAYVSLISIAMQYFDKDYRNISMGIFQGFFSFGIFYGDRVYIQLIQSFKNSNSIEIFYITLIISVISIILVILSMKSKKKG